MKKTGFLTVVVVLLIFTVGCGGPAKPAPTYLIGDMGPLFSSGQELYDFLQNPSKTGYMDPIACLQPANLFPGAELKQASGLARNLILCDFSIDEAKEDYMPFEFRYASKYENISLSNMRGGFYCRKNGPIISKTETVAEVNGTLRSSEELEDHTCIYTASEIPVAYHFEEGKLESIRFSYRGFVLSFGCFYENRMLDPFDWETDSPSPYIATLKKLTDPAQAEQEMQRLLDVIDAHLANFED